MPILSSQGPRDNPSLLFHHAYQQVHASTHPMLVRLAREPFAKRPFPPHRRGFAAHFEQDANSTKHA
jgi:hypothetical protein